MEIYKLVDQNYRTRGNTLWELGVTQSLPPKENPHTCSPDVFHAYAHLNLGLLLNMSHARIEEPRILLCNGDPVKRDWDKVGCFVLTPVQELAHPNWFYYPRTACKAAARFAVACAELALPSFADPRLVKVLDRTKAFLQDGTTDTHAAAMYAMRIAKIEGVRHQYNDLVASVVALAAFAAETALLAEQAAWTIGMISLRSSALSYAADAAHTLSLLGVPVKLEAMADKAACHAYAGSSPGVGT